MKRLLAVFLVLAGTAGVACYQDDAAVRPATIAPTKVFITDDPFPFSTVASVNIFVTTIEASTGLDSNYVTIATPNQAYDLLTLQQGDTAFLGQGTIDAGKYSAVRMTVDVDRSSIKYLNGSSANIQWPAPGHGLIVFYAGVEEALAVPNTGSTIVIEFDVGRTFVYNTGTHVFVVPLAALRAVNSARTGAIAGQVTRLDSSSAVPVPDADVSVYGVNPSLLVATGRTDAHGAFRVGFLPARSYLVVVEQPSLPWLASVTAPSVTVTVGGTSNVSVVLPPVGSGVGPFLNVTGPDSVSTFGEVRLLAAVGDSSGNPIPNPNVAWASRDTNIVFVSPDTPAVAGPFSSELVSGRAVGATWIVATSGALADSVLMTVVGPPAPPVGVATVTITPPSLPNLSVNDSLYFIATLRDSSGNEVSNGTVYWSIQSGQDSTVVDVFSFGLQALIRGRRAGSTIVQAREPIHGAHASAAVTVH